MHILVVPFNYKNVFFPMAGNFIDPHLQQLQLQGHSISIINVVAVPLTKLTPSNILRLGPSVMESGKITQWQWLFPAIPKSPNLTQKWRVYLQKCLYKRLRKQLSAPDITHVHMFPGGDFARWLKREQQIPYLVTEHLSGFSEERYTQRQLHCAMLTYADSAFNISVSNHLKALLEEKLGSPFKVIPNSINTDHFTLKSRVNQKQRFITVGRLVKIKNHEMLIAAFSELVKNNPDVHLTIVGDGPEKANLKQKIKTLGLLEKVTLTGHADLSEVRSLMHEQDIFVLSSVYETFGVVMIEALSSGLPVVSTDCQGAKEIVTAPELGIICDNNQSALTAAMQQMLEQEFDSELLRHHVVERYSAHQTQAAIMALYQEAIAEVEDEALLDNNMSADADRSGSDSVTSAVLSEKD